VWLFIVVIMGPAIEELVFRGVILNRWAYKWGIRKGVVLSSLLFALGHRGILWPFVVGVVLSLIYLATRSLLVSIVCHMLVNALAESLEVALRWVPASPGSTQSAMLGMACLVLGLTPVTIFLVRHWPPAHAPVLGSA
jgi:membrane protease YdiL (CAAX protease family)